MHLSVPLPHRRPLALALALCIATPALAQQQPGAEAVELDAVNVRGERADASTALTGFGATRLLDAPASIAVIERQQLLDRQARVLSEVLRADASTGDAYAPIGYYENFVVRGYSLNAANSYRINGLSAVGEQSIALENKQQVQILKGLAGLQSGVNEPAGLIDYRTKRPEHVRSVTLGTDEQGSRYVAADLGDWFGAERSLGLRVNAAREDINSYVDRADGYRNFLSLAGDWKIAAAAGCGVSASAATLGAGLSTLGRHPGTARHRCASPARLPAVVAAGGDGFAQCAAALRLPIQRQLARHR
ncbi:iron permease [Xanthomonas arboricola pv. pruni str. MAFF 311562]|uniref:Iron permease n=1 Tax=Xanthomonas arboricola pv. pruni str. MAFF 311562 TaxID=1414836 RepID=W4S414_9XANT|nr:iron permease [Xanthomonas arboricola pv. pruni str. MAFF 311562]